MSVHVPTVVLKLGPLNLEIDRGIVGSEVRINIFVEVEQPDGTFDPFDFVGYSFDCDIRSSHESASILTSATVNAPGAGGAGYVDVILTATQTTALGAGTVYGSVKFWPTGSPEVAVTLATFTLPIELASTR